MNLFQRIFSHPLRFSASQGADHIAAQDKLPMAQIQQALRDALHDCADVRCQRVSYNIGQAKTPVELWALRSDLHQCIAQTHSERVAAARINDIATVFEGWIPASQLARIQPGFRHSAK